MTTPQDHFWAKVEKSEGCWTWKAEHDHLPKGYGRVKIDGRNHMAHRVSWMWANGQTVPAGMFVCHHCDNPPCVRPDHLFIGTAADNNADCISKGRSVAHPALKGLAHHMAWVPDEVVREVRESYAAGHEVQEEIANRLGLAQRVISSWIRGQYRVEAGGPIGPRAVRKRATNAELTARQARSGREAA